MITVSDGEEEEVNAEQMKQTSEKGKSFHEKVCEVNKLIFGNEIARAMWLEKRGAAKLTRGSYPQKMSKQILHEFLGEYSHHMARAKAARKVSFKPPEEEPTKTDKPAARPKQGVDGDQQGTPERKQTQASQENTSNLKPKEEVAPASLMGLGPTPLPTVGLWHGSLHPLLWGGQGSPPSPVGWVG